MTGKPGAGSELAYGQFGLKVLEPGWITTANRSEPRRHDPFREARGKIGPVVFGISPLPRSCRNPYGQGKALPITGSRWFVREDFSRWKVYRSQMPKKNAPGIAQTASGRVCKARRL